MKNLVEFLNEARSRVKGTTTIVVKSTIEAALIRFEFLGQISDGKYENASPRNHWEWVTDVKFELGNEPGYKGLLHSKKYVFNEWIKGIEGKDEKYNWAIRCLSQARGGQLLDIEDFNNDNIDYDGYCFELMDRFLDKNPDADFKAFKDDLRDYEKKYVTDSVKANNEAFFNKFKESRDKITEKDMKNYFKSAYISINNRIV